MQGLQCIRPWWTPSFSVESPKCYVLGIRQNKIRKFPLDQDGFPTSCLLIRSLALLPVPAGNMKLLTHNQLRSWALGGRGPVTSLYASQPWGLHQCFGTNNTRVEWAVLLKVVIPCIWLKHPWGGSRGLSIRRNAEVDGAPVGHGWGTPYQAQNLKTCSSSAMGSPTCCCVMRKLRLCRARC